MTPMQRRSPLGWRDAQRNPDGSVAITEKPFEGKLILRGDPALTGASAANVLGAPLPAKVRETATGRRGTTQWLSPDEWLIVTAPGAETDLIRDLTAALTGMHHQIANVTDYYTTITLGGAHAREMLMKIATIDFDPLTFKSGMGVTTNLGRANPWLRATSDDSFDIIIRISMADYLWCLLAESGHEWGLAGLTPKGAAVPLHLPHFETAVPAAPAIDPTPTPDL